MQTNSNQLLKAYFGKTGAEEAPQAKRKPLSELTKKLSHIAEMAKREDLRERLLKEISDFKNDLVTAGIDYNSPSPASVTAYRLPYIVSMLKELGPHIEDTEQDEVSRSTAFMTSLGLVNHLKNLLEAQHAG